MMHGDDTCDGRDDDLDGVVDDDFAGGVGEALDGLDNDCDGMVDEIGTVTCAPGSTDWRCCAAPTLDASGGKSYPQLTFIVDRLDDALAEDEAAEACAPVGFGPSSGCTLRGVVRRAEQLRFINGRREACEVVGLLEPGDHELLRKSSGPLDGSAAYSLLRFGGGRLTLRGTGPSAVDTRITRVAAQAYRLINTGQEAAPADEEPSGPLLTVQNLTLRDGATLDALTSEWGGGAIRGLKDTVVVERAIVEDNEAKQEGGALQMESGTLIVRDSVLRHNVTVAGANNSRGGAIWTRDSSLELQRSAVVANYADGGGGVAVAGGTATIVNNTFSKNVCEDAGCGLQLTNNAQVTLAFNTIVDNQASDCGSGGLGVGMSAYSATLAAYGNILARNKDASNAPSDCAGATVGAAGHNLVGVNDATSCPLFGASGGGLVGSMTTPVDPNLLELPGYLPPNGNPGRSCGAGPTDSSIKKVQQDCKREPATIECQAACAGAETPEQCVLQLGLAGPAVGAFGSAAAASGAPDACPPLDQRSEQRPATASCSLGAVDMTATAKVFANVLGSGVGVIPTTGSASLELRLSQLEIPQNLGDNYGLRVSGRVRAPATGQYRFFIAGDDNVALYLSTDETSLRKQRIAYHDGFTAFHEWNKYATQKSALIPLVEGQLYYIEAVVKEADGVDNLSVGWLKPGESGTTPSQIVPLDFPELRLPRGRGEIYEEKWHGVSGNNVSSIPLATTPDFVDTRPSFEGFSNVSDNYGARLRGWLTAPLSGDYTFWISGDDNVALYLSPTGPADKVLIASHTGYTAPYQWNKYATQKSQPVQLAAGRSYYIEALLKDGTQDDHIEVGWLLPGQSGSSPSQVIPGEQLSPYFPPAPTCLAVALPRVAATASSQQSALYPALAAIDGSLSTRWSSQFSDPQWLTVDLGQIQFVERVKLSWEEAASADYDIRISNDGVNWRTVLVDDDGDGGVQDLADLNAVARYVKVHSRSRATAYGNSLWEVDVFGDPLETCDPR